MLVIQSGRVLISSWLSTLWIVTQSGRVEVSSGLSIHCIFCCRRWDSVKSGKGFISEKSSTWSVVVLRELVSNVPATSTVSAVEGGSVNRFLGPGVGLGEVHVELFLGGGVISGRSSLWARYLDKACWLNGSGEVLVGNISSWAWFLGFLHGSNIAVLGCNNFMVTVTGKVYG